jgi:hypothetical protein
VSRVLHRLNGPLSIEHSNVTFISFEVNSNVTIVLLSAAGGAIVSIVVGATVSIIHTCSAGVLSSSPLPSFARTANVCEPSLKLRENGDVHAVATSPSMLHSNFAVSTFAVNRNVDTEALENSAGASVIIVSSGPVGRPLSLPVPLLGFLSGTLQLASASTIRDTRRIRISR